MPEIAWSTRDKAYVKTCSSCKKRFVVPRTDSEEEAIEWLYTHHFYRHKGRGDGLHSMCTDCFDVGQRPYGKSKNEMIAKQNWECKICGIKIRLRKEDRVGSLAVPDHCHRTEKVRGILCYQCNTNLGRLGKLKTWIAKAEKYMMENR